MPSVRLKLEGIQPIRAVCVMGMATECSSAAGNQREAGVVWGFEKGAVYNRRIDIHERFGGQRQGGITTPADRSYPIFIVTGEEGISHGYSDRMREDGVFEYSGEGQVGDMQMLRGNRAIRDHAEDGRDLLLFRKVRGGIRFEGQFVFEAYHYADAPDSSDTMRKAIVFELRQIDALVAADEQAEVPAQFDLDELRDRAIQAAKADPLRSQVIATAFERSRLICTYVFARAGGKCENCNLAAPFTRENGSPYLEAHHIRRLTDGGPDDPRFMIGLCPNCHRQAHHGAGRQVLNDDMLRIVQKKEPTQ
ncbi:HNH endonuclease [Paracoccus sp. KR1-242]|uniref:HNH endonuclease n=1 Tax=Paracoccus sp. KR1-242 TaxID=3410028 RepID=UPI003BFC78BE